MTDVKIEGGCIGKGGGGGWMNNFRSKNYSYASNTDSHKTESASSRRPCTLWANFL